MIEYISTYIANFGDVLFWIMSCSTPVILGLIGWSYYQKHHNEHSSATSADARFRIHTSVQLLAVGWIIYALTTAVPATTESRLVDAYDNAYDTCSDNVYYDMSQDERVQYCDQRALALTRPDVTQIEVPVETEVTVFSKYDDAYDDCVRMFGNDSIVQSDAYITRQCTTTALIASRPDIQTVERPVTVEKETMVPDTYTALKAACINSIRVFEQDSDSAGDITRRFMEREDLCHENAMESRSRLLNEQ